MPLKEEHERVGNWLFRWRSYFPLLVLGLLLIGMKDFTYIDENHDLDLIWESFYLIVSFIGLGIRGLVIGYAPEGTSGRNALSQKAVSLNKRGLYSVVRHPLYFGNFFIWLGISLFVRHWTLSIICMLIFWLYYERIILAEEEFLRRTFGTEYEIWADGTPCFFPRLNQWQKPERPFSWRKALKDEYSGFFAIIFTFTVLEMIGDLIVEGKIKFDIEWCVLFLFGLVTYVVLRTMKKTGLLEAKQAKISFPIVDS